MMKIFLLVTILAGFILSTSAGNEELTLHESIADARALLTLGIAAYTNKADFDAAVALNPNAIPKWTVDFQNLASAPSLPNFQSILKFFDDTNNVQRISLYQNGGIAGGNNNQIKSVVPGPNYLAFMEVNQSINQFITIDITGGVHLFAWGAKFEGITQDLVFTLFHYGIPYADSANYGVNSGTNFVGFVSTIYPISRIEIRGDNNVATTFRMDDVQGALQPAPSSMPSRMPSRKPSQSPSRKPSAKPSRKPSAKPSASAKPSRKPSSRPSRKPSSMPSSKPSRKPSSKPSKIPTATDTCFLPTDFPILGIVFTVICLIIDIFT